MLWIYVFIYIFMYPMGKNYYCFVKREIRERISNEQKLYYWTKLYYFIFVFYFIGLPTHTQSNNASEQNSVKANALQEVDYRAAKYILVNRIYLYTCIYTLIAIYSFPTLHIPCMRMCVFYEMKWINMYFISILLS